MTREEAITYWENHYESGNTEQNDAVYMALKALKDATLIYDKDELRRIVAEVILIP